jgi:hypothetical protein
MALKVRPLPAIDTLCEYCVNDDHSRCRKIRRRLGDVPKSGILKLKVCQCPCNPKEPI